MTSSFSTSTVAVIPSLVAGYDASRGTQHAFHPILGGGEDVYARVALPRTGTFTVAFENLADAQTLADMCAGTSVVTFADSDVPTIGMRFLADGQVRLSQDDTRTIWLVTVDFHEVNP